MTHQQVRKKYNAIKLNKKAKVTKAVEKGKMADGRLVAASMGQFKKYGKGTGGGPPMFPPPQDVPDEETETDTEYGDNYLLHKTPSRMKVMEPRQRKSIFAFASSEGIKKDYEEINNKEKTNDDMEEEPKMQRDGDTTNSSRDNIPPKKVKKGSKKKMAAPSLSSEADLYFHERIAYWKKASPLELAALKSKAEYQDLVVKDAEEWIKKGKCPILNPSMMPSSDDLEDDF